MYCICFCLWAKTEQIHCMGIFVCSSGRVWCVFKLTPSASSGTSAERTQVQKLSLRSDTLPATRVLESLCFWNKQVTNVYFFFLLLLHHWWKEHSWHLYWWEFNDWTKEFPLWALNNGACCLLHFNGCTHCLAVIVRTGSSLWRKQEVDTWWTSLMF